MSTANPSAIVHNASVATMHERQPLRLTDLTVLDNGDVEFVSRVSPFDHWGYRMSLVVPMNISVSAEGDTFAVHVEHTPLTGDADERTVLVSADRLSASAATDLLVRLSRDMERRDILRIAAGSAVETKTREHQSGGSTMYQIIAEVRKRANGMATVTVSRTVPITDPLETTGYRNQDVETQTVDVSDNAEVLNAIKGYFERNPERREYDRIILDAQAHVEVNRLVWPRRATTSDLWDTALNHSTPTPR